MSLDANIYIFSENPPFSTLNKGKYGIPPPITSSPEKPISNRFADTKNPP